MYIRIYIHTLIYIYIYTYIHIYIYSLTKRILMNQLLERDFGHTNWTRLSQMTWILEIFCSIFEFWIVFLCTNTGLASLVNCILDKRACPETLNKVFFKSLSWWFYILNVKLIYIYIYIYVYGEKKGETEGEREGKFSLSLLLS